MVGPKGDLFGRIAAWTIRATGGRWAFLIAIGTVVAWAISGPFFHYSEMWQLIINTGTTIVTFLMVFLIQNAQNRESKAVHIKLDELILAVKRANNEMIDIEHLTEEQLDRIAARYRQVAERYHQSLDRKLNGVSGHMGGVEERVDHVEDRVERVEEKVDSSCGPDRADRR